MNQQNHNIVKMLSLTICLTVWLSGCRLNTDTPNSTADVEIESAKQQELIADDYEEKYHDILGDFTIVAYCWDGYNMLESIGPLRKGENDLRTGFMDGYIDPATCVGFGVSFASAAEGFEARLIQAEVPADNDFRIVIPGYSHYVSSWEDSGGSKSFNYSYGLLVDLAAALDLSAGYAESWATEGAGIEYGILNDTFPAIERDADMRRIIEYVLRDVMILDENHVLLSYGTWNLLAVRNEHLAEGCNCAEIALPDIVFSRDA